MAQEKHGTILDAMTLGMKKKSYGFQVGIGVIRFDY